MPEAQSESTSDEAQHEPARGREELRALLPCANKLLSDIAQELASSDRMPERIAALQFASKRLTNSVIRPLRDAVGRIDREDAALPAAGPTMPSVPADDKLGLEDRLWQLAKEATRMRLRPDLPTEVQEAAAALQDLAVRWAPASGPDTALTRVDELREIQAELPSRIQAAPNGPYLATNVDNLTDWLGERLQPLPEMALCRCGASAIKPFCDGAHVDIGFLDDKDPKRVPDRRDTYFGQQVEILDNRGICQHSGLCTDRLASVFRQGQEPFVAPSGGRMDEIIRAVRDCPSGALSYAIDGREAREQVDYDGKRDATIEVTKDGPYRITGSIPLTDGDARDERRDEGASREHYALCRCGHSLNKPFCSGMHWYVDFHDPVPAPDHEPTVFEWCGGLPALTRMTRIFYEKYVPQDPLLAPLFANMAADHPQRVARWLGEVFGGPKCYSDEYGGYPRMFSQHIGKDITEEKRARWVALLLQSAQDTGLPNDAEFSSIFSSYIEWGSRLAVENSQPDSQPPQHMPMPHWDWNTASGPPGSRVSALAPHQDQPEQPVVLPSADEPVRFEKHIKPLFRKQDRQAMESAFDLWSYADVKQNAQAILERLTQGSMPCDGAWPKDRVEVFQRWVASGTGE
jgi:CDGSH-type Zn-finger protein/truncated hemoglobin YjbI